MRVEGLGHSFLFAILPIVAVPMNCPSILMNYQIMLYLFCRENREDIKNETFSLFFIIAIIIIWFPQFLFFGGGCSEPVWKSSRNSIEANRLGTPETYPFLYLEITYKAKSPL